VIRALRVTGTVSTISSTLLTRVVTPVLYKLLAPEVAASPVEPAMLAASTG